MAKIEVWRARQPGNLTRSDVIREAIDALIELGGAVGRPTGAELEALFPPATPDEIAALVVKVLARQASDR